MKLVNALHSAERADDASCLIDGLILAKNACRSPLVGDRIALQTFFLWTADAMPMVATCCPEYEHWIKLHSAGPKASRAFK